MSSTDLETNYIIGSIDPINWYITSTFIGDFKYTIK